MRDISFNEPRQNARTSHHRQEIMHSTQFPELAVEFGKDRNLGRESLLHYMEPLQTMENNLLTVVLMGRQEYEGRIYQT